MSFSFITVILVSLTLIPFASAREECGSILSIQLYCPSGYHCCSTSLSTCCGDAYFCASDTLCLHLAVIIVPVLIAFGVIVTIVICCVCQKKNKPGLVIQPQQSATTGMGMQQQQFSTTGMGMQQQQLSTTGMGIQQQ